MPDPIQLPDPSQYLIKPKKPIDRLTGFADERGLTVTSTTGGKHNPGSKHYQGEAVDVRTKDQSPEYINEVMRQAQALGYRVRDERQRPAGQQEWGGPHLHMENTPQTSALDRLPDPTKYLKTPPAAPQTEAQLVTSQQAALQKQSPIVKPALQGAGALGRAYDKLLRPPMEALYADAMANMEAEKTRGQIATEQAVQRNRRTVDMAKPQRSATMDRRLQEVQPVVPRLAAQAIQKNTPAPDIFAVEGRSEGPATTPLVDRLERQRQQIIARDRESYRGAARSALTALSPATLALPEQNQAQLAEQLIDPVRTADQIIHQPIDIQEAARRGGAAYLNILSPFVQGAANLSDALGDSGLRVIPNAPRLSEPVRQHLDRVSRNVDAFTGVNRNAPSSLATVGTEGAISSLPYFAAGGLGAGMKGIAALGAVQNTGQTYQDVRSRGAAPDVALQTAIRSAPIGALEGLLGTEAALAKAGVSRNLIREFGTVMRAAPPDVAQEVLSQVANNFNQDRPVLEGVVEAAIGSLATSGAMGGATAVGQGLQARQQRTNMRAANAQEAALLQEAEQHRSPAQPTSQQYQTRTIPIQGLKDAQAKEAAMLAELEARQRPAVSPTPSPAPAGAATVPAPPAPPTGATFTPRVTDTTGMSSLDAMVARAKDLEYNLAEQKKFDRQQAKASKQPQAFSPQDVEIVPAGGDIATPAGMTVREVKIGDTTYTVRHPKGMARAQVALYTKARLNENVAPLETSAPATAPPAPAVRSVEPAPVLGRGANLQPQNPQAVSTTPPPTVVKSEAGEALNDRTTNPLTSAEVPAIFPARDNAAVLDGAAQAEVGTAARAEDGVSAQESVSRESDIYRTKGGRVSETQLEAIDARAEKRAATETGEHGKISAWARKGFDSPQGRTTALALQPELRRYLGLPSIPENADNATLNKAAQHTMDALAEKMGKSRSSEIGYDAHTDFLIQNGPRLSDTVKKAYADTLSAYKAQQAFEDGTAELPEIQAAIKEVNDAKAQNTRQTKQAIRERFEAIAQAYGLPKVSGTRFADNYFGLKAAQRSVPVDTQADVTGRSEPQDTGSTRQVAAQPATNESGTANRASDAQQSLASGEPQSTEPQQQQVDPAQVQKLVNAATSPNAGNPTSFLDSYQEKGKTDPVYAEAARQVEQKMGEGVKYGETPDPDAPGAKKEVVSYDTILERKAEEIRQIRTTYSSGEGRGISTSGRVSQGTQETKAAQVAPTRPNKAQRRESGMIDFGAFFGKNGKPTPEAETAFREKVPVPSDFKLSHFIEEAEKLFKQANFGKRNEARAIAAFEGMLESYVNGDGANLMRHQNTLRHLLGSKWLVVADMLRPINATGEISYVGRQGFIGWMTHPILSMRAFQEAVGSKGGVGKTIAATGKHLLTNASDSHYWDFVAKFANSDSRKFGEKAGLSFAHTEEIKLGGKPFLGAEENAMVSSAQRLPALKQMERLNKAFIDGQRLRIFEWWIGRLQKKGVEVMDAKGNPTIHAIEVAKEINRMTGRGNIHEKAQPLVDVASIGAYSPRFAISTMQYLNPLRIVGTARRSPEVAKQQALQYAEVAALSTGLALTLQAMGFAVNVSDPDKDDFMVAKLGNWRIPILQGGLHSQAKLAVRMGIRLKEMMSGDFDTKGKGRDKAAQQLGTYLRYKEAPAAGLVHNQLFDRREVEDYKTGQKMKIGHNALGQPVPFLADLGSRAFPMTWQQVAEAYQQEGLLGVAKTAPEFGGLTSNLYESRREPLTENDQNVTGKELIKRRWSYSEGNAVTDKLPVGQDRFTRMGLRAGYEPRPQFEARATKGKTLYSDLFAPILSGDWYRSAPPEKREWVEQRLQELVATQVNDDKNEPGKLTVRALELAWRQHLAYQKRSQPIR